MDVKVQCAQCLEVPVPAIAMPGIEQLKQPMVRLAIHREGLRQPANPDRDVRAHLRIPCVLRGTTTNRASSRPARPPGTGPSQRSEEHTSELQSLMRISYSVFCL